MLRIGITGGYGSGKSTVAKYFEENGYPVIYADPLAKELMQTDKTLIKQLTDLLGKATYTPDGRLNTQYIAKNIFTNPQKKRVVERIVHPAVLESINTYFSDKDKQQSDRLAFVEAALIYESKIEQLLDYVIVVTAPLEKRIEWIKRRDGADETEIRNRINAQHSDGYLVSRADFVIENTGDISYLHNRCAFIENLFLSMEHNI